MCGINVIVDKKSVLPPELIVRMNKAIAHRGPDYTDWRVVPFGEGRVYVGVNRLKVIDPNDRANQPFGYEEGHDDSSESLLLAYNGEAYNFFDLRNQLLNEGVQFTTASDTEVVLHWLRLHGAEGLTHIKGMYALAYVDASSGTMLLACDPSGMKPLYVYNDEHFTVASSELRGALATSLVKAIPNAKAVAQYLAYKHATHTETFYTSLAALQPGVVMQMDKYFNIGTKEQPPREASNLQAGIARADTAHVEQLLQEALLNHMVGGQQPGLFLSGGTDSTLLLAMLYAEGYDQLQAFSVVNTSKEAKYGTNDYLYARKAAAQYGAVHYEVEVDHNTFLQHWPLYVASQDQPIGDSAGFSTWYLALQAANHTNVVLSGAGADELFGGYHRHRAFQVYLNNEGALKRLAPILSRMASIIPDGRAVPGRKKLRLLKKLANTVAADPRTTWQNFVAMEAMPGCTLPYAATKPQGNDPVEAWLYWALTYDRTQYLVHDVLALNDRMCMQHGLEMRMPYLDEALQQFLLSMPASYRLSYGPKWLLKKILTKHDGKAYAKRPKEGFGLPIGYWLRKGWLKPLLGFIDDGSHALYSYVEFGTVQHIAEQHMRGKRDYSQQLYALMLLAHWLPKGYKTHKS